MKRIAAVVAMIVGASQAQAQGQPQCAPRAIVLDHLAENFGESRQSIGMSEQGRVMEVFASPETGSWTVTITLPNGMTCLVAAGESFEVLAETPTPQGAPS